MAKIARYVIYDPPSPGFPYLVALFVPDMEPKFFPFDTPSEAQAFIDQGAIKLGRIAQGDD